MKIENPELLKSKFNLSYHIDYAMLADQAVDFRGKAVLEVGGSLPREFVLENLEAGSWTAVEEMSYWDETLGTGLVTGTPPAEAAAPVRVRDAVPGSLAEYTVLAGAAEELPDALASRFDAVFSIAAFEHILRLPEALDRLWHVLKPGGRLFSMFAPVWSCHNGHHLPNIQDATGRVWDFSNPPIPPWAHLLWTPVEAYDYMVQQIDADTARKIVYYLYQSPHVNRYFLDDYLEFARRSGFSVLSARPYAEVSTPDVVRQELQRRYPSRSNFESSGLILILEK